MQFQAEELQNFYGEPDLKSRLTSLQLGQETYANTSHSRRIAESEACFLSTLAYQLTDLFGVGNFRHRTAVLLSSGEKSSRSGRFFTRRSLYEVFFPLGKFTTHSGLRQGELSRTGKTISSGLMLYSRSSPPAQRSEVGGVGRRPGEGSPPVALNAVPITPASRRSPAPSRSRCRSLDLPQLRWGRRFQKPPLPRSEAEWEGSAEGRGRARRRLHSAPSL